MSKSIKVTPTQLGFYFDQTRCMSCNACTVACKDWNQVEPGKVHWREQFTYEKNNKFFPLSIGCNHCVKPACRDACSQGAITKSDDGIVTINRKQCIGLLACADACPFAKPKFADDKQEPNSIIGWQIEHPAQKCTMCVDRLEKGLDPACVSSCVGRALDFGDMEVLKAKYTDSVQVSPTDPDFEFIFKNNKTDTKPSLLIKKKTAHITISKSSTYNP